jgi:hypothetical protein
MAPGPAWDKAAASDMDFPEMGKDIPSRAMAHVMAMKVMRAMKVMEAMALMAAMAR